jgi:hypothetical protein
MLTKWKLIFVPFFFLLCSKSTLFVVIIVKLMEMKIIYYLGKNLIYNLIYSFLFFITYFVFFYFIFHLKIFHVLF